MSPLDEVRAWMSAQEIEAAYFTNPISIAYLSGFHAEPHERLMALAVRPSGATLIVPALERENAERIATGLDVVPWRDGEDPYAGVQAALGRSPRVAVEKDHLTVLAAERLLARADVEEMVDVAPQLRRLRARKQDPEVERLQRAAGITDRVTEQVLRGLRVGRTESQVAAELDAAIRDTGAKLSFETLVQSGPNSALPHLRPSSRALEAGDLVLLDFGAACDGYRADTTRMAVIGEPSAQQKEIHRIVLEAHDAAVAAVRAGVNAGAVDAAARRVIEAAGHGEHFFHRVGHGLGLEAHEEPSLDPGSSLVLEPGMVITIEPGIYIQGWGGVRIEDDVLVEADGGRLLTRASRDLFVAPVH